MRAGTDAQVIPVQPVIDVVPAATTLKGEGRDLITPIAVACQHLHTGLVNVIDQLVLRQLRRLAMEQGIGFQGELIVGEVAGGRGKGPFQFLHRGVQGLAREAEHQVQVDVIESGRAGLFNRRQALLDAVYAPERLQTLIVHALHPQRQAVDPGLGIGPEVAAVDGARVGLQGDLHIGPQAQSGPQLGHQPCHGGARHQAGCATAEKDATHPG